jgi:hypothetical protein
MKKKFFNMIEVLLALGVTAIGIMGIMAVIPVTLNANRDASADNLIADVANTKFAEIAFDVKKNFVAGLQGLSTSKPSEAETWIPVDNVSGLLTDGNMVDDGIQFSGTKFAMGRSGKAPELTGDILLWKTYPGDVVGVSNNSTSPILVRVYMEVSWPSSVPYAERKKRVYVREFLDPASSLVREPGT